MADAASASGTVDPAPIPNMRRRMSTASEAEVTRPYSRLSDSALISSTPGTADPDTCRICRGEGTFEEPLFYPCKCSGSIKYVHQDCLMEWLSHSQKKHCELCKTPFRFTKLYSPNMPPSLPLWVFLNHMVRYIVRNTLVWMRAALVAGVWLGLLPYLMRAAWSFLFWISDEGLGGGAAALLFGSPDASATSSDGTFPDSTAAACASSPLLAETTSAGADHQSIDAGLINSVYGVNFTSTDPFYSGFLRLVFGTAAPSDTPASLASTVAANGEPARAATLLSDVGFLHDLTRSPAINRTVIAILEGQIITILVIACFILIILVRDYVVQQQPEVNIRAVFAAADDEDVLAPDVEPDMDEQPQEPDPVETLQDDQTAASASHGDESDAAGPAPEEHARAGTPGVFRFGWDDAGRSNGSAAPRFDVTSPLTTNGKAPSAEDSVASAAGGDVPSISFRRPHSPPVPQTETGSALHEYLTLYREAEGDPDRILKLAKDKGLEERLDYWIRLTRTVRDRSKYRRPDTADMMNTNSDLWESSTSTSNKATYASSEASVPEPDATGSSWRPADSYTPDWSWGELDASNGAPRDKGKGRAGDEGFFSLTPEPRATTPRIATAPATFGEPWTHDADASSSGGGRYPTPPSTAATNGEAGEGSGRASPSISDAPHSDVAAGEPAEFANGSTQPDVPDFDFNAPTDRPLADAGQPHGAGLPRQPATFADRVADFMWRDVDGLHRDDELVEDAADGFAVDEGADGHAQVDRGLGQVEQDDVGDDEAGPDREVVEAAVAAGLDPEAIEDAEDFEGIMELVGMRGPITGLLQNAIFCAFLVSVTIFLGIFVPYNIGRVAVWTVANPARPARMLFSLSKFVQDLAVLVLSAASYAVLAGAEATKRLLAPAATDFLGPGADRMWNMSVHAAARIVDGFTTENPLISATEMRNFSALSHEALLVVKGHVVLAVTKAGDALAYAFGGDYSAKGEAVLALAANASVMAVAGLKAAPAVLTQPNLWVINFSLPEPSSTPITLNPELAYWDGTDRFWAVFGGYLALSIVAALYLRRGTPLSTAPTAQEWEAAILDALDQASGVVKVILIIGIEMLVFPLYCGLLLDVALLPLFEDTTLRSRAQFTLSYPLTSIFVHWFVGTGYMFHFALFVSMCRKIMRKGVLYFIRDPDDPEFHPVRDVLERNLTTQLRKILFSAFVYGALVVVCLGGVVWGLFYALSGVLPIHYSSNEPVLEFPIDLLFYNFLMPLAVEVFKPSDGLHAMYTWWFRKCARALRVTWYLFGERRIDEEGVLLLPAESPHRNSPWWTRVFLELNPALDAAPEVRPRTWHDLFEGGTAKPTSDIATEELAHQNARKAELVQTKQLRPDGRFVRTPASDQVKIPKGLRVFLDVTEANQRTDGRLDVAETDLYSSDQYQFVYIPPHFRLRVFLFILSIWLFAAITGVAITIVPLVFGRWLFRLLIPPAIRTNDIYTFSIGIYILGSAAYSVFHIRSIYHTVCGWSAAAIDAVSTSDAALRVAALVLRAARLAYSYLFILLVFPLLVASLMELYLLIPLNTYMYSTFLASSAVPAAPSLAAGDLIAPQLAAALNPQHSVRVIQAWTVGIIYLKLASRVITTWHGHTRLAAATRAVLRRGWQDPDAKVLTRAFVVPLVALWLVAVSIPLLVARVAVAYGAAAALVPPEIASSDLREKYLEAALVLVYRLSFPCTALCLVGAAAVWSLLGVLRTWKLRIRDEAYLVGERLHNFGTGMGPGRRRGAWRAGATRL